MGYTHYWRQQRDLTPKEWTEFTYHVNEVLNYAAEISVEVVRESDREQDSPLVDRDFIAFNGAGEDGHETFFMERVRTDDFAFCKTARKPYDQVVAASLCILHYIAPDAFEISSDGWRSEWQEGLELAVRATHIQVTGSLTIPPLVEGEPETAA